MNAGAQKTLALSWLLLIHQLPAKPAYLRVKIWRRLQGMGAIAVKNAVHALPMSDGTQEDFEWLLREIVEGGGEAFLCEARLMDGLSDEEVQKLFDHARDADYENIAKDARTLTKSLRPNLKREAVNERRAHAARLRKLLAEPHPVIQAYDQEQWAKTLYYQKRPIEPSLQALSDAAVGANLILRRHAPAMKPPGVPSTPTLRTSRLLSHRRVRRAWAFRLESVLGLESP